MINQKIGIFGSCVTRDIWTVLKLPHQNFTFFARTSIPSMMAPPPVCFKEETMAFLNLDRFDARSVDADIRKTAISTMEIFCPRVLFVDLIDERFGLLDVDGTIVMNGAALFETGLSTREPYASARKIQRGSEEAERIWDAGLKLFAERVLSGPLSGSILFLHECYWATEERDDRGGLRALPDLFGLAPGQIANVAAENRRLQRCYDKFRKALPHTIALRSENCRLSDPKHIWGPAPYHFIKEYYLDIWNQVGMM